MLSFRLSFCFIFSYDFERGLLDWLSSFARVLLDQLSSFSGGDVVGRTGADERSRVNDCVRQPACFRNRLFRSGQRRLRCPGAGGTSLSIGLTATQMSFCAFVSESALLIRSAATLMPNCGGVGSLDRVSDDSAVMLCSWFRNRISQLGQRKLSCCAAGGDDGVGRAGADVRSRGIDWRSPVEVSDIRPFGPILCCDALSQSGLSVRV